MHKKSYLLFILAVSCLGQSPARAQDTSEQIRFSVEQFEVIGDNPIGKSAYRVLAPFVGEHYGLEGLSAAADALEQAVIKAGYSFHRVSLPPQQLTTGTVQMKVSSFAIGNIEIKGNQFFDESNILNSLPELRVGKTPNTKKLSRSLKLANTHAAKQMELQFREGEESDTIDASLTVQDKNPQIVFITLDNSGTRQVDEYRTTFGYQHGNLFNRDHAMTATLTTSPENPDATLQYGLNYRIPLYSQGASIDILLSDSEVNSGTIGSLIQVSGTGSIFGVIYNKTLLSDSNISHHWSLGLQYRLFENEFNVGGPSTVTKVLSTPLELGYAFERQGRSSSLSGGIRIAVNVPSGNYSEQVDYQTARIGAENEWSVTRFNLSYDQLIGNDWLLHLGLSGQASDDLLISGEQFGVGGLTTLRGFEERSITGDAGQQASVELWMPPVTAYQLRFLVFYDIASLEFNDGGTTDLSSAGLGMRWSWKQNLNLSLDYGQIIDGGGPDTSINRDGDDKLHLELVYRF
ncbi:MAG: ShlB/FhaC/HecB family hemolysin secretion/activation protein [Proteobacteria bacterium]|nr:ShlB/FhaC/HecB family hemolysin secretion/activation protein [Pseudomonadota bacterium]